MAEITLPLSVHVGSTPLDRLLFNCPARVTCAQLLQSVQQAMPQAVLSHLSTFHHDRIPLDAEMAQYVQAHDAVIAHFVSAAQQPQQPSNASSRPGQQHTANAAGGAAGVSSPARMAVAPSSAFASSFGPHPPMPPPPHMLAHNTAFSPSHASLPPPPMPYMMYGPPPPPPAAFHPPPPMHPLPPPPPPPSSAAAASNKSQPATRSIVPALKVSSSAPSNAGGAISMVEASQLATQSVKPALERYRTTHGPPSSFLQSGSNNSHSSSNSTTSTHNSSAVSPTARALLNSLHRDETKRGRKRGFQRVSGDVEAETESEGVSDDESMGSASSWSAVDDEADSEDTRAAQAAQLIASLSQSPGGGKSSKRITVKLEPDVQVQSASGSRLIRSASPGPSSAFDSTSLLKNKHLKHASVLVLYQAKDEQRLNSNSSSPSTPISTAPSSSPASPVHSMVLSPASSAVSSPTTPSAKSVASHIPAFSPRALANSTAAIAASSHATTSHAAHPQSHTTVAAVAASSVPVSAASSIMSAAAHYFSSTAVLNRHRSRLGIPVMRERRRRRRRTLALASAVSPGFPMAAAVPAMPVSAAPAKAVMAAISYMPNAAGSYQQQHQQAAAAAAAAAAAHQSPAKERDEKRTYNGKVRVYHNVPVNIRTGRVAAHG